MKMRVLVHVFVMVLSMSSKRREKIESEGGKGREWKGFNGSDWKILYGEQTYSPKKKCIK